MVILWFDLLCDLVTYLFDFWPQNNDISMCGAILHMWTKSSDDQSKTSTSVPEQWHFQLNLIIEGWDSEVTL